MLTKRYKSNEGFTIIETLIVLAIAALILLIVFLAVPALERNAHNTQRTNDISSLLAGVAEFGTDNSGGTPTGASISDGVVSFSGATGTSAVSAAKLGFYTAAPTIQQSTVVGGSTTPASTGNGPGLTTVDIIVGAVCAGNYGSVANATAQDVAAVYSVQTSSGYISQCTQAGS